MTAGGPRRYAFQTNTARDLYQPFNVNSYVDWPFLRSHGACAEKGIDCAHRPTIATAINERRQRVDHPLPLVGVSNKIDTFVDSANATVAVIFL